MSGFIFKKLKVLSILLVIKTVILVMSITLNILFYFYYDSTKKILIKIINSLLFAFDFAIDFIKGFIDKIVNASMQISGIFNNRELAIGVLIIFVIVYVLSVKDVRKLIPGLLITALNRKLMYWYITMIAYFAGMLYVLEYIGFWDDGLLKDSIIWFLVVGFVTTSRAIGNARDLKFFILFLKDNLKIITLLEFISNMYTYSLIVEIILVIITTFIVMLVTFIEHSPNYQDKNSKILKNFFNLVLTIIGIFVIYHSVRMIIHSLDELVFYDLLKDSLLPIILSVMFVPYIYLFVIVTLYEVLFVRINFMKTINENLRSKLKLRVFLFCNINISRISNFAQKSKLIQNNINTSDDIGALFSRYKEYKQIKHNQEGSNFS